MKGSSPADAEPVDIMGPADVEPVNVYANDNYLIHAIRHDGNVVLLSIRGRSRKALLTRREARKRVCFGRPNPPSPLDAKVSTRNNLRSDMELGKHLRREADAEHCFSPNTCLRVGLDRMAKR
jgi:hypothetical protein